MKKNLLSIVLIFMSLCGQAAFPPGMYTFSQFTAPYSNLSNGNIIIQSTYGSYYEPVTQCGFFSPWEYFGYSTAITDPPILSSSQGGTFMIIHRPQLLDDRFEAYPMGFATELHETGNVSGPGKISCQIDGTSPNRIYKIQFDSVYNLDEIPVTKSTVSYQIWYYESDYSVEFHYGPKNILNGHIMGGVCGLRYFIGTDNTYKTVSLAGDPASPSFSPDPFTVASLTSVPAQNTVYRFTPMPLGVETTKEKTEAHIIFDYPNKKAQFYYSEQAIPTEYKLTTVNGQTVPISYEISGGHANINLENLSPGIYVFIARSSSMSYRQKIIVY